MRLYNVIKECFFVESNFLCLKPHSVDDDDDDARDGDARDETARGGSNRRKAVPSHRVFPSVRPSVARARSVRVASLKIEILWLAR